MCSLEVNIKKLLETPNMNYGMSDFNLKWHTKNSVKSFLWTGSVNFISNFTSIFFIRNTNM